MKSKRPEPKGLIFKGPFTYAGGHPEHPTPEWGDVYVRDEAIVFIGGEVSLRREKSHTIFEILAKDVRGVQYTQTGPTGRFGSPDYFVIVEVEYRDRVFEVRFMSAGWRRQDTAFAMYGAVNAMIGRRLTE